MHFEAPKNALGFHAKSSTRRETLERGKVVLLLPNLIFNILCSWSIFSVLNLFTKISAFRCVFSSFNFNYLNTDGTTWSQIFKSRLHFPSPRLPSPRFPSPPEKIDGNWQINGNQRWWRRDWNPRPFDLIHDELYHRTMVSCCLYPMEINAFSCGPNRGKNFERIVVKDTLNCATM